LTLGFVGNPNYGYGEQLVKMLPAFRAADARLIAYGQTPHGAAGELARASDVVELRGFVPTPEEAWQGVQRDCDAIIFPYLAPSGFMDPLYRVHFPSKLPEYLALGMPIVMVGPDSATGVRWARRHPAAVLLLEADARESWSGELRRLARDGDLRARLAAAALSAGREQFDPVSIRREFLRVLSQSAGQKCLF
jgi:glycosyltransferase involved in cell wall biosynthesis